jgi:hypothetical protein
VENCHFWLQHKIDPKQKRGEREERERGRRRRERVREREERERVREREEREGEGERGEREGEGERGEREREGEGEREREREREDVVAAEQRCWTILCHITILSNTRCLLASCLITNWIGLGCFSCWLLLLRPPHVGRSFVRSHH